MSKSEVSRMAQSLDVEVAAFRARPLQGPFRYIFLDAMYLPDVNANSPSTTITIPHRGAAA